jgi:hypothetical protein
MSALKALFSKLKEVIMGTSDFITFEKRYAYLFND